MINYVFTVVFGILTYILYQKFTRRKLPPGPMPLPFVGNLIELARTGGLPHEVMLKLSKKYGDVFSLTIGIVPTVVVNGNEAIRNLMKSEDFDNRIEDEWILDRCYGEKMGLFFSENEYWRDTRRLTMRILKDFGFGKNSTMEELIVAEFEEFIDILKRKMEKEENTLVVDGQFNGPMANVTWILVSGTRFKFGDPEFKELVEGIESFVRSGRLGGTSLLGAYPFLAKYLPGLTGFDQQHKNAVALLTYFEKVVKKHRDMGNYKTSPKNFIDEFLASIENNKNIENSIYTDKNLVCVLNDLFAAGSETSANATSFAIRLMVQYPEIQAKVYAEIIASVIGTDRMITLADKSVCNGLRKRIAPIAPISPRRADKTCEFGQYEIPVGTTMIVNLYSASKDESVWDDPNNFRPERFLNENGDIVNSDKLWNFGGGPMPLPFVGNLIELARTGGLPHEAMLKLSKKYGDVFSLTVGIVPTVVINGNEAIRSVIKSEDFDNHIDEVWVLDRSYGKKIGFIFSENEYWRDTRRLTMKILKVFGFGKNSTMEDLIVAEFEEFIDMLKTKLEKEENTMVVDGLFNGAMANVVWSLVSGSRFKLDDQELNELVDGINCFARAGRLGGTSLLGAYPFLAKYLPGLTGFDQQHKYCVALLTYFEKVVKRHRDMGNYKTSPKNFIDEFLASIEKNKNIDNSIYTDENLVCVLNDLFSAGSETSANGTAFAIRLMVQYPEIQAKVYAEIDSKIQTDRMITLADKSVLRYTDATILETMRIAPVIPFGPRRAHKTCNFGQYEIPGGTTVIVNFYSAGKEKSVWGDPDNFRPERFLNENGDIVDSDKLWNFGGGKRNCIGEITARTSLFIAISNLVRTFKFEPHPQHGVPETINVFGFAVTPAPFTIRATSRK